MLGELISWWTEQMHELVSPLLHPMSRRSRDAMRLECGSNADGPWRVVRRSNGADVPIATIPTDAPSSAWRHAFASRRRGERLVVSLGRPFLVRRTTLPVVASPNIDNLLRYEMDRLTPFQADTVLFTHRVVARDRAAGKLLIDVAVLPKAWIGGVLERLTALSIRPDDLEDGVSLSRSDATSAGPATLASANRDAAGAEPWCIALNGADPSRRARARFAWRAAAAICAMLVVTVISVPFARQSLALAAIVERIGSLRPRIERVDALRRQIASASEGAGRIAAARERGEIAIRLLAELTDVLGDDTYLTSLSLRHARVVIEGRSAAATKLIAALATDPQLRNPSFGAPVVRANNGMEVFTIQAGFGS